MVTKDEILEYAKLYRMPAYQIEKEYFQHLLLFLIYSETSSLVFKGGTAIKKAYGLTRFSEDLDFTQLEDKNYEELFDKISKMLKDNFAFENEAKKMKSLEGIGYSYRFKIIGPLVTSPRQTESCYIYIEISKRETPKTREIIKISPIYKELPEYTIIVMSKEEIVAEKIRAIITREKHRDIFDLWYLLKAGTTIRIDWVKEKMSYYKMDFSKEQFFKELARFGKNWEKELKPLMKEIPDFKEVVKLIHEKFDVIS